MTTFALRGLKLRTGEELRERLELELEPLVFGGEPYRPTILPVPAQLVAQRATSGDVFRLTFDVTLEGPCVRCLAPALVSLQVDALEYEAPDAAEEELRSDYVSEGELDVGAWARDQIALTLPEPILCRPDCRGLCPVCGRDLNVEPHEHEDTSPDSRWAALESLRLDRA